MVRSWLSFWSPSSALVRAIVHTPTVSLILLLQFLFILLYFFYRRQGDRRNVLDFEKSLIYTHIVYYTRSLPYDRGIYGRTRGEDDIIIYSNNDNNIPVRTLCARMVRTYNYMTGRSLNAEWSGPMKKSPVLSLYDCVILKIIKKTI